MGDERKFITAVVVPKFDHIMQELRRKDITFDESQMIKVGGITVKVGDDFTTHPEVMMLIEEDIREANQGLEEYETIKKLVISNRVFMPDLDEVTPTMKVKYRNVIRNFASQIEELYR